MWQWLMGILVGIGGILLGFNGQNLNAQSIFEEELDDELLEELEELEEMEEGMEEEPEVNIDEIEEFYRDFEPARLEKLKVLRKENPERFKETLKMFWDEMIKLKRLKQENPEEFERIKKERQKQRPTEKKPQRPGEKPPFDENRPPEMMPPEKINTDEVMQFLKEFRPEVAEELSKLRKERPEIYEKELRRFYFEMMHLRELKKNDPKQFELIMQQQKMERELPKLVKKYRECKDDKERESIKKEMRAILEKLFDMIEQAKAEEIKRLEEEINKLKEKMKKRESERSNIIEDRLKQMTGEKEEWGR